MSNMPVIHVDVDVSEPLHDVTHVQVKLGDSGIRNFLFGVMRPILVGRLRSRFSGEGDDASGKWAQLADTTVRIRQSLGLPGAHPINVRTGEMLNHLTSSYSLTEGGRALNIPGQLSGATRKKVAMAQKGGGTAPARPVLALSATDTVLGTNALLKWCGF